jgi:hypothetical protein
MNVVEQFFADDSFVRSHTALLACIQMNLLKGNKLWRIRRRGFGGVS